MARRSMPGMNKTALIKLRVRLADKIAVEKLARARHVTVSALLRDYILRLTRRADKDDVSA